MMELTKQLKMSGSHDLDVFMPPTALNAATLLLAAGAKKDSVVLYDCKSGEVVNVIKLSSEPISLAFSRECEWLGISDWNNVVLYSIRRNSIACTLTGHMDFVFAIAFSPDSKLMATASKDTSIKLWNLGIRNWLGKPKLYATLGVAEAPLPPLPFGTFIDLGGGMEVRGVDFSPDQRYLVSGHEDKRFRVWNTSSPAGPIFVSEPHSEYVIYVRFSPDGQWLGSASGGAASGEIRLWTTSDWKLWKTLEGYPRSDLPNFCFLSDSSGVASYDEEGNVILWDTRTGKLLDRFQAAPGSRFIAALTPTNEIVTWSRKTKVVQFWKI